MGRPKKTHKKRSCKAVRRRFNAHKASVLRAIKHWRRKYRKCRSHKCRHRVLKRRRRLVRRLKAHYRRAKRCRRRRIAGRPQKRVTVKKHRIAGIRIAGKRVTTKKRVVKKRRCGRAIRRRFNAHKASVTRAIKHWRRKYRKCRSRKCRHRV